MKNKKSILKKFESEKINQMQKITGGEAPFKSYTAGPDGWSWAIHCHGDIDLVKG
jgi:hypothetical protein